MSASGWLLLAGAGASAGVFCAAIVLCVRRRLPAGRVPFAPVLTAVLLFAGARIVAILRPSENVRPFAVLAAIFLTLCLVQVARAKGLGGLHRMLVFVPALAMLLITIAPLCGPSWRPVFAAALAVLLCVPAPIALAYALRNFDLIRKTALDRVR